MAADFQPARVRSDAVGVMDDRRRQLQHASGDLIEGGIPVDLGQRTPAG